MVALEEYDTISKDTFTASANCWKLSKATQKLRTSSMRSGPVRQSSTPMSLPKDEHMDRDIQALKVVGKKGEQGSMTPTVRSMYE
jgi:hypothetical protein